jgi:hypothetical protein
MKTIKVLNLYACLGGNRYKWDEVAQEAGINMQVVAVEWDEELARLYKERFPNDKVIVADAHQYLLEHYKDFDFIWSSPPCPSHSRARFARHESTRPIYPDFKLYEEVFNEPLLEIFDNTDEGYIKAQEVEKRLIKPVLNDKWCLNENCGGKVSRKISRQTGERYKKFGIGVCGMSYEQRRKNGLKSSSWQKENSVGIFGIPKEQRIENSRKSGIKTRDLKIGVHGLTPEQKSEAGKKGGLKCKENKSGVCGISKEQRQQNVKKTNSQKWMCAETGFITNSGSLSRYQKARGIDTSKSNRRRIA